MLSNPSKPGPPKSTTVPSSGTLTSFPCGDRRPIPSWNKRQPSIEIWGKEPRNHVEEDWFAFRQPQSAIREILRFRPPKGQSAIRDVVAQSKWIIDLPEDFDGEGSPRYSRDAWNRAVTFLERYAKWFRETQGEEIPIPEIDPGPNGSIDIHWKSKDFELLLNIPSDPSAPAEFYGDDYGAGKFQGTFNPASYNFGLITWLKSKR